MDLFDFNKRKFIIYIGKRKKPRIIYRAFNNS